MKHRKLIVAAAIGAVLGAGVSVLNAQQPGFKRTQLQDRDLSVADRHAVVALAEFGGGVAAPHTHPGEELGYILEGTLQLEVTGQPPVVLKAGDAFFVPANTVHGGRNLGDGTLKVLATYIVEKGKPVASPAK
jgi:quercetin dioxygenase-like cupin family protein